MKKKRELESKGNKEAGKFFFTHLFPAGNENRETKRKRSCLIYSGGGEIKTFQKICRETPEFQH